MARRDQQSQQRSRTGTAGTRQSSGTPATRDAQRNIPVSGEVSTGGRIEEQRGGRDRPSVSREELARRNALRMPLTPWGFMRQFMDNDFQRLLGLLPATASQFGSSAGTGVQGPSGTGPMMAGTFVPNIEVIERPNEILVRADLPGMRSEDIDISVDEGVLTISGERQQEFRDEEEGLVRTERVYGQFFRSIPLPEGVNTEKVEAQFRNGVLDITVPVARREKRRRINVST
jgi:HSP20 family protein